MELFFILTLIFLIVVLLGGIVFVSYVFLDYELFKKIFYPFDHPALTWRCDNLAIIKNDRPFMRDPEFIKLGIRFFQRDFSYCGYVAFKKNEVPEEWHGNKQASGLVMLNIHGGITFAEVNVIDKVKEKQVYEEMKEAHDILSETTKEKDIAFKFGEFPKKAFDHLSNRVKLFEAEEHFRRKAGYDWVIFGFDCAHSGDEENPDMGDLNHIIKLTMQMQAQMIEFSKVWNLYMATESDKDRAIIIDSVRDKAEIRTELGMGGMLNLMMGKI